MRPMRAIRYRPIATVPIVMMAKSDMTGPDTSARDARHPWVGSSMTRGDAVLFQDAPAIIVMVFKFEAMTRPGSGGRPGALATLTEYKAPFTMSTQPSMAIW